MQDTTRDTIKFEDAQKTADRLFFPGDKDIAINSLARLKWAIDFAQAQPGGIEERIALTLFPDGVPSPEIQLFTEEETKEARNKISAMLKSWVNIGRYDILEMPSHVFIQNHPTGPHLGFDPSSPFVDYDSSVKLAVLNAGFLLLIEGHRVRLCHAPAKRKPGQECGKIFVGRPDQEYCSYLCQSRASTRRRLKKLKKGRKHHGKK